MVPTIYYFFWVRYHPSRIYSQKKSWQETKYTFPPTTKPHPLNPFDRGPTSLVLARYRLVVDPFFPPTTKPHPLNPLDREPTSLVLAGYKLVVLRPFCVCLPRHLCCSRLILFRSTTCFVLFLHTFPAMFVIFLWFGFFFSFT